MHLACIQYVKFSRLSDAKQSRVYLPEAPFPHDGYVKSGRLKYFTTTHGGCVLLQSDVLMSSLQGTCVSNTVRRV